jgi:hypothetical protein
MEASLTILYTGNLRGDLALLPRVYSFIKQLRAHYSAEAVTLCPDDPAPANPTGKILLLDLGDSCAPDVWHCAVTGGRSMLVVLDSMGYDAANVSGFLASDARGKLGDLLHVALVDDAYPHEIDDIVITTEQRRGGARSAPTQVKLSKSRTPHEGVGLSPLPERRALPNRDSQNLTIVLQPSDSTRLEHRILHLARVEPGQVGIARMCTRKTPYELEEHTIFDLPRQAQPDPTIAGMVDFVIREAKYTQKKRQI